MVKLRNLWNVIKALLKCDEYLVITARQHNPYGETRLGPIKYEYMNNTDRKIFYLFAKEYVDKTYDVASNIEFTKYE